MTDIDEQIKKIQEAAAKKVAELKAQKARERAEIDALVLTILAEDHADVLKVAEAKAVRRIEEKKQARKTAAKKAAATRQTNENGSGESSVVNLDQQRQSA